MMVTCSTCKEEHFAMDLSHRCPTYEQLAERVRAADEVEKRHVREWQDSILRHEEKRDEEARMRETLERRIEELERLRTTEVTTGEKT